MNHTFTWKGFFHLPQSPKNELPGILTFSQGKGVQLDLFGQFDAYLAVGSREARIVLGVTANGKRVTLVNAYEQSRSLHVPGFPESSFGAIYLFVGGHYESPDKLVFHSCSIEYADFNHWVSVTGFERPAYNLESKELNIRYRKPDKIEFLLKVGWIAAIEFGFSGPHDFFVPTTKATVEQRAVLSLKPLLPAPYEEYEKLINSLGAFLALNYFAYPPINSIEFFVVADQEDEFDSGYETIQLLYDLGTSAEKYKTHTINQDFLLQYKNCQPSFEFYIQRWLSLYEQIEATMRILSECLMQRNNPMELHFIGLTQAMENMHRKLFDIKNMFFKERLIHLVEKLPSAVRNALLANEGDFENRVKNNRNFYTHYDVSIENFVPATLGELFVLSEKLKVILITMLLQELGFSSEQVEKIILGKGRYLFNHLLHIPAKEY